MLKEIEKPKEVNSPEDSGLQCIWYLILEYTSTTLSGGGGGGWIKFHKKAKPQYGEDWL